LGGFFVPEGTLGKTALSPVILPALHPDAGNEDIHADSADR
jgi:hypothetical protein